MGTWSPHSVRTSNTQSISQPFETQALDLCLPTTGFPLPQTCASKGFPVLLLPSQQTGLRHQAQVDTFLRKDSSLYLGFHDFVNNQFGVLTAQTPQLLIQFFERFSVSCL